jgi:serine/threonine protein kinase
MPTLSINPKTCLSGDDAKEFFDFLTQQKQQNISFFKKGYSPCFNTKHISFEQDVICEDLDAQGAYTCNFVGRKIGEGGFATVYNIDKSVTVSNVEFSPSGYSQPEVVKVQQHCECIDEKCSNHNTLKMLEEEYQISVKVPHLGVHKAILQQEKRVSYSILNKLPGTELFEILVKDRLPHPRLTLRQRIELSLGLLQAVKTQVSGLNLIHLDIKPENIMVDLTTVPMTVNFLDYAFGQQIPEGNNGLMVSKHAGSKGYTAPEVVLSSGEYFVTPAADLFSLMKILMLIWGLTDSSYGKSSFRDYQLYLRRPQNLSLLFKSVPSDQKALLCQLGLDTLINASLTKGLARPASERGTIDEAIESFQKIHDIYTQSLKAKSSITPSEKQVKSVVEKPLPLKENRSNGLIAISAYALFQPSPLARNERHAPIISNTL